MKILFVGNDRGRSKQRSNTLIDLGYKVSCISFEPADYLPGISKPAPLWDRVCSKLGYPHDQFRVNEKLLKEIIIFKPEILWIEKGLMIRPSTLEQVKKLQPAVKVVSYTEDDMFARHNQSAYYRGCLPLYDVVFTTKSYNCNSDELPALGAKKVVFVDKAFDKHTHRPLSLTEEEKAQLGADVGFIGTFEQDRAEKMLFLAENGIHIRVWGNGWTKWVNKHPKLKVENRPIYNDDYVKAICATRINLCFLRKMNRDLQTDRTMEIPACGAFMLGERTEEHERLFEDGKEATYFNANESEDLLEKVKYYLYNEEERAGIAKGGRDRCVDSGYSHHDRLCLLLRIV